MNPAKSRQLQKPDKKPLQIRKMRILLRLELLYRI